jgi:putative spermidine/putrescine transport system substrate-binding protein
MTTTTTTRPTRRQVLAVASIGIVANALLSGCGSSEPSETASSGQTEVGVSGQIVWADYGGGTNAARQAAYFDSFVEATGVDVVSTSLEATIMYQMLGGEAGDYDAMHVGLPDVYNSMQALSKLDPEVPRDDALPADVQDYAFGGFAVGQVKAYLGSTFPDGGPKSWADFYDLEKFPGKRALPGTGAMNGLVLETALLADGVEPEDLYPIDYPRAFAKLNTIADQVVFYTEYPQAQQLLLSGSVAMAYGPSGQFTSLIVEGEDDVKIAWDQAFYSFNVIAIPREAPNKANIQALAAWMGDPERQARFAEQTLYGPGNTQAWDHIDPAVADNIVTSPSHTSLLLEDSKSRAEYNEEMINAYAEWLASVQ